MSLVYLEIFILISRLISEIRYEHFHSKQCITNTISKTYAIILLQTL